MYLDSSILVSSVSSEAHTPAVLAWMDVQIELSTSDWGMTEGMVALSRRLRMRLAVPAEHARSVQALREQIGSCLSILPVTRAAFSLAVSLAEKAELGLRAGDALHLAIASVVGETLATLDKKQAEAGRSLGIKTLLLPVDQPARSS